MAGVRAPLAWVVLAAVLPSCLSAEPGNPWPQWAGQGSYRIQVTVPPVPINRARDERPARVKLDFLRALGQVGGAGAVDLATLQVIRYSPKTGKPFPANNFRYALGPFDLPYRFDYVDPSPYSFMYYLQDRGDSGTVVWAHVQEENEPSHYSIYFDLVQRGRQSGLPSRAQIGDCDALYQKEGRLGAYNHVRPAIVDWDGDGLTDVICGDGLGHVTWFPNRGTRAIAAFRDRRLLEADGKVIRPGWLAAPLAVDWDDDGDFDLIVAREPRGTPIYYENTGTRDLPRLSDKGGLQADGAEIEVPFLPCPEAPYMKREYTSVPEVVDWDGDGDKDLLLGGYLTGFVFLYENTRQAKGVPVLKSRGPLEADGKTIDMQWAAAPTVADLDGDGDLDLITGAMKLSATGGGIDKPGLQWLHYFENTGAAGAPRLSERPFPVEGGWPGGEGLAIPRLVDIDADKDLDLLVGMNLGVGFDYQVRLYRNVGNASQPAFRREGPLGIEWSSLLVSIFSNPPGDIDGDGDFDLILGGTQENRLARNIDPRNPAEFRIEGKVTTADGKIISHVFPPGDAHTFPELFDWDTDGDLDYLLGRSAGDVWYYENTGGPKRFSLSPGAPFKLEDGSILRVGKMGIADKTPDSFESHSGDRSVLAAGDFNGDGKNDLMVADANGNLYFFPNRGCNRKSVFGSGQTIIPGNGSRAWVGSCDWNGDKLLDLIFGRGVDHLLLNEGTPTQPKFTFDASKAIPRMPWIPYPFPYPVDWNRDGDVDLVISSSYCHLYFMDHSFVEHGYGEGQVCGVERRK
ncbi:MAG: FG-GAP repeat domain-containing protein [Acidobacteriota bacterium]